MLMILEFRKYIMQLVVVLTTTAFPLSASALTVSPTSLTFEAAGGTKFKAITVSTPATVTATADADWLSMAVSKSASGSSITVIAKANEGTARTATITVSAAGQSATVAVVQEGVADPYSDCRITATAADIAKLMYPGWNLGNTMEANNGGKNFANNIGLNGETSWQGTKTTQEVIDFVKSQGFRSVRIPCNWVCGHISNATNVTIDAAWMARVREVVDYCIKAGLYVVLNDHYDGGWVETSFADLTEGTVSKNCKTMTAIWTQIAAAFKDYDEHLLFAGLNEPNVDNAAKTAALIRYEQAFVDAVRATGGNNARRILVVQGPSTDIDNTYRLYDIEKIADPIGGRRLMLEVHYYSPWQFSGMDTDASWGKCWYFWGSANHDNRSEWSDRNTNSSYEESYVKSQCQKMKSKFADKGYPVILGEYNCQWRHLGDNTAQQKHDNSVKLFHKAVNQYAIDNGLIPFVWDINVSNQNGKKGIMSVLDRSAKTVFCTPAMTGITEGVKAATWGGQSSGIFTVPFDRPADVNSTRVYSVLGQQVSPGTKGLVIIGGRKYVRK